MLPKNQTYQGERENFRWQVPARFNIAAAACDAWAAREPERMAIQEVGPSFAVTPITYGELRERSARLANHLAARGVRRCERIAILLPQCAVVAVVHLAAYRMGAIALPLAALFGLDALAYRLNDAGARVLVTDAVGMAKLRQIRSAVPTLEIILSVDGPDGDASDFSAALESAVPDFPVLDTDADDPAMMIYTSGTTGPPKGALHAHRVLLGHLPGVQFSHEFLPQPEDLLWTPADWAWAGGLLNILLPGLYLGVPVVCRATPKFEPEAAYELMARLAVRNVFIPPTALRMMRPVEQPRQKYALALRTLVSAGEALGAETFAWAERELGIKINEFYGQTECNYVLSACAALGVSRAGAIGKPVPGHQVAVIRPDGSLSDVEELGQIAIRRPDPVMFLGYWNQPEATAAKFLGDWMTTGDEGRVDDEGYFRFHSRNDDVITSAGFRIGPGEIEDCLLLHPAVALAAAVGKPDELRTEIVRAFIVLRSGHAASDGLADEIRSFVRTRLSAHEYPREITFVTELPLTTTGKVIRRLLRERP